MLLICLYLQYISHISAESHHRLCLASGCFNMHVSVSMFVSVHVPLQVTVCWILLSRSSPCQQNPQAIYTAWTASASRSLARILAIAQLHKRSVPSCGAGRRVSFSVPLVTEASPGQTVLRVGKTAVVSAVCA